MVGLINAGAPVGDAFVPDISVGRQWSAHWKKFDLEAQHGARQRYLHNYPEYFPQAASNPQEPYCYPDAALPEFRRWLREHYMPQGLPKYLKQKLPSDVAKTAIEAMTENRLRIG